LARLSPLLIGPMPLRLRVSISAVLQTVLFPVGFLSISTLLSWSAYLIVCASIERTRGVRGWVKVYNALAAQTLLSLAVFGILGTMAPLSIVANVALAPLFPIVFAAAVGTIVLSAVELQQANHLILLQERSLDFIFWLADISRKYGGVFTLREPWFDATMRTISLGCVGAVVLQTVLGCKGVQDGGNLEWQIRADRG